MQKFVNAIGKRAVVSVSDTMLEIPFILMTCTDNSHHTSRLKFLRHRNGEEMTSVGRLQIIGSAAHEFRQLIHIQSIVKLLSPLQSTAITCIESDKQLASRTEFSPHCLNQWSQLVIDKMILSSIWTFFHCKTLGFIGVIWHERLVVAPLLVPIAVNHRLTMPGKMDINLITRATFLCKFFQSRDNSGFHCLFIDNR